MNTRIMAGALVCGGFIAIAGQPPTIWYVDDDGAEANGCTSWLDACPELQTALSLANPNDQIWVAVGTYKPDYDVIDGQHTGNRTSTFQLINGVAIYGGFDGTEAAFVERAGLFEQAILSGDLLGDDGPEFPDFEHHNENSYHVVSGSGTNSSAMLDGFKIIRGTSGVSVLAGGGLLNISGSPMVVNCSFVNNVAVTGGGMFNGEDSRPIVIDCTFFENYAHSGGGIYNFYSAPMLTNCLFIQNITTAAVTDSTSGGGGGIFNLASSSVISNCHFSANSADNGGGGGLFISAWSSQGIGVPHVVGCTFSNNSSKRGGGLYLGGFQSSSSVTDCTFKANTASLTGGAVFTLGGAPEFSNSSFADNVAPEGGGVSANDSFVAYSGGSPTFTGCLFANNSGSNRGGH